MSPYDYDCRWKLWKVCFEYLLAAGGRLLARPVRAPDGERRGKGRGKLVVLFPASQLGFHHRELWERAERAVASLLITKTWTMSV